MWYNFILPNDSDGHCDCSNDRILGSLSSSHTRRLRIIHLSSVTNARWLSTGMEHYLLVYRSVRRLYKPNDDAVLFHKQYDRITYVMSLSDVSKYRLCQQVSRCTHRWYHGNHIDEYIGLYVCMRRSLCSTSFRWLLYHRLTSSIRTIDSHHHRRRSMRL